MKGTALAVIAVMVASSGSVRSATLILHNGKIITVDKQFRLAEAVAVQSDRIQAVGSNREVLSLASPDTQLVDLEGKTVLPGLIDSHVHPLGAALYEADHVIPEMHSISDVLQYIRSRADTLDDGQWIVVRQVFITRLQDQRYPTRAELDAAAPHNPVMFSTGPDASLNSLALKLSGIDKNFTVADGGPGYIEKDPSTGEPTGILRSCTRLVKYDSPRVSPNEEQKQDRLRELLADYNSVGITSISDRATTDEALGLYAKLKDSNQLTCRVYCYYLMDPQDPIDKFEARLKKATQHPLYQYNNQVWLRGIKVFLDGGMLTGSAYMRQPWGVSSIYSITDPQYRGLLFIQPEQLEAIVRLAMQHKLQMTAHAVGDGAVHSLIDAYQAASADFAIEAQRPCITHCNFLTPEAIAKMQQLGVVADMQPVWLYLDGRTLRRQFGADRLRYFQPYQTLFRSGVTVGGGSDHMQKIGSLRSVNPYNPFLGIWIAVSRQAQGLAAPIWPEERLSREDAIRLYTINNAFLTFEEQEKGSLEAGKLADMIVLDRDILTCPVDQIRDIQVQRTFVGGHQVYPRQ